MKDGKSFIITALPTMHWTTSIGLFFVNINLVFSSTQPITQRREYVPLPLKIPRELQKALPYSEKPKITPKAGKEQRVLVVKDPKEIQVSVQRCSVVYSDFHLFPGISVSSSKN